jgi:DNA-directed RNA polymerase subunit beta
MEARLARDSGVCVVARRRGIVESVDATRIVVRSAGEGAEVPDIYHLMKYQRSNQSTCYTQKPIVRTGDRVMPGDVLADGASTTWANSRSARTCSSRSCRGKGFNFEDSILVSERIAKDDVFTSIHIEEFECVARDTKLGKEEITRDIPNVGEEA